MRNKKTKATTYDPQAVIGQKLTWSVKTALDLRKCAVFYGMEQSLLAALGQLVATGKLDPSVDEQYENLTAEEAEQVKARLLARIGGAS